MSSNLREKLAVQLGAENDELILVDTVTGELGRVRRVNQCAQSSTNLN